MKNIFENEYAQYRSNYERSEKYKSEFFVPGAYSRVFPLLIINSEAHYQKPDQNGVSFEGKKREYKIEKRGVGQDALEKYRQSMIESQEKIHI